MKILLLCWRDSTHPHGGGSERYLERVGQYLASRGHEVVFYCARHTEAPRTEQRDGITIRRAGGKFTVYPRALLALALGRLGLGSARGADIIVDTQNGIPFFARLVAAGWAPVVLLSHHCHRQHWPVAGPVLGRIGWFLESHISPLVYRGAPAVTVSAASKADLAALGTPARIIANGLDPLPEEILQLPRQQQFYLISVARLVPAKQLEHAIDVLDSCPDAVLDIVGSGWWAPSLRRYAQRRGLAQRVRFWGHVSEEMKHALLARADIHLMPSVKEGWGLAVMEAAQHAVPTVGYREALRDSVRDGHTGVVVTAPEQLAPAVRHLLADAPERRRLGEGARRFAAQFSWEDTGAHWEELMTQLSAGATASAPTQR